MRRIACTFVLTLCMTGLVLVAAPVARAAGTDGVPVDRQYGVADLASLPVHRSPVLDLDFLALDDEQRSLDGLPERFALPEAVLLNPDNSGSWETLDDGRRLWRLRIGCADVLSLNLGFTSYDMPYGGRLLIYAADGTGTVLRFDHEDNRSHGQLWTPVLLTDELVVELTVPAARRRAVELELTSIGRGYRFFGEDRADKAGACNIDVICPEGDDWRTEIASVGVYHKGGSLWCTGFMINNTAQDGRPLFLTAHHCGVNDGNAPSVVVYWNYESIECGDQSGGSLEEFTSGSLVRADYAVSDMTLIELNESPDPVFGVKFAGWDRSDDDPSSAVAIHHPRTDEKSISFENEPCTTTSYLQDVSPGDGTHIRIDDWNLGTTEGGSSGSPLFNQDHRVVGQLHGGWAGCDDLEPTEGNGLPDWYGRLSVSWTGGGSASSRLSNWLDPDGSGVMTLDLFDPDAVGLKVTPLDGLEAAGPTGGPFSPASLTYTLTNQGEETISFAVNCDSTWVTIAPASGTIDAASSVDVTLGFGPDAGNLAAGFYRADVQFTNATDGDGDTVRQIELAVGDRELIRAFDMDSDPGWQGEGDWAYGSPTGSGGQYGNPDPIDGYDGTRAYGYNLAGDYENLMPFRNLTTGTINCSRLTGTQVTFRRWLGVESPSYDHATFLVSGDGTTYSTVWRNTTEVTDGDWVLVTYDLSEWADGNSQVRLRWTMGPTDNSRTYCGWNLDNVRIWGYQGEVPPDPNQPVSLHIASSVPTPFTQQTVVTYSLARDAGVRARIMDIKGRRVRDFGTLAGTEGDNEVIWDGQGDSGRRLPSGLYILMLEAGDEKARTSLTYIH